MAPRRPDHVFESSNCNDTLLAANAALVRRYGDGSKYIGDVLVALDALLTRAKHWAASHLVMTCVRAVHPAPRALWEWCAQHVEYLDEPACVALLRAAGSVPTLAHRVCARADVAVSNEDLLEALAGRCGAWKAWHGTLLRAAQKLRAGGFRYRRPGRRAISVLEKRAEEISAAKAC